MQFIDLKAQYQGIEAEVNERIREVLESGQYILGSQVAELEEQLAKRTGSAHCIAVSSGTDALLVAMMALGISRGDEVIIPAFTFIAPAEMAALLGAKPVFVDIDNKTYNIDPDLIESAITPKTKAIVVVDLYGQCADFDAVNSIAKKYNLAVIEDAAQSFGAFYKGRPACSLSTIGCTSFFPSKPLGCYGDGGACFTDDDELADKMRCILKHGQRKRYYHTCIGLNARFDTIQAAVLLAKLSVFDDECVKRLQIAAQYHVKLNEYVITPYIAPYNTSVYAQYTIRVDHRDEIYSALEKRGIPLAIHYPISLNKQPVFSGISDAIPVSEKAATQVLSLPFHPYLKEREINTIASAIIEIKEQLLADV